MTICKYASSGCNYPEGECVGLCPHHSPLSTWADKRAYRWPATAAVLTLSVLLVYGFMEQHDEAQDMEDARVAAERQDQQAELQRKALQAACGGPEATVVDAPRGGWDCFDTNGRKTKTIPGLARPDSTTHSNTTRAKGARLSCETECANSTPAGLVPAGFLKG